MMIMMMMMMMMMMIKQTLLFRTTQYTQMHTFTTGTGTRNIYIQGAYKLSVDFAKPYFHEY